MKQLTRALYNDRVFLMGLLCTHPKLSMEHFAYHVMTAEGTQKRTSSGGVRARLQNVGMIAYPYATASGRLDSAPSYLTDEEFVAAGLFEPFEIVPSEELVPIQEEINGIAITVPPPVGKNLYIVNDVSVWAENEERAVVWYKYITNY